VIGVTPTSAPSMVTVAPAGSLVTTRRAPATTIAGRMRRVWPAATSTRSSRYGR
jgi:hypothetical protein